MKDISTKPTPEEVKKGEETKPGVATNVAEDEKVDAEMVYDATKDLNNNHAGDSDLNPDAV